MKILKINQINKKGGILLWVKLLNVLNGVVMVLAYLVDTKKKFSFGKALVGNTVGGLFGPVGAVVGTATGIKGKNGKTKFVCSKCGNVWEKKI